MLPPTSLMAAVPAEEMDSAARGDALWSKYAEEIDRESAREKLAAKLTSPTAVPEGADEHEATAPGKPKAKAKKKPAKKAAAQTKARAKAKSVTDDNTITDFLRSREGRATVNNVARGAFGVLKGFLS